MASFVQWSSNQGRTEPPWQPDMSPCPHVRSRSRQLGHTSLSSGLGSTPPTESGPDSHSNDDRPFTFTALREGAPRATPPYRGDQNHLPEVCSGAGVENPGLGLL